MRRQAQRYKQLASHKGTEPWAGLPGQWAPQVQQKRWLRRSERGSQSGINQKHSHSSSCTLSCRRSTESRSAAPHASPAVPVSGSDGRRVPGRYRTHWHRRCPRQRCRWRALPAGRAAWRSGCGARTAPGPATQRRRNRLSATGCLLRMRHSSPPRHIASSAATPPVYIGHPICTGWPHAWRPAEGSLGAAVQPRETSPCTPRPGGRAQAASAVTRAAGATAAAARLSSQRMQRPACMHWGRTLIIKQLDLPVKCSPMPAVWDAVGMPL